MVLDQLHVHTQKEEKKEKWKKKEYYIMLSIKIISR